MEITIKCDLSEEATVAAAISELCPYLKDFIYEENIEIRSLDIKFLKSGEEILILISPDMANMVVRKISTAGNVFKILYHIMNDSFADLVHQLGDFDILINGDTLSEDDDNLSMPEYMASLFRDKNKVPTAVFDGI